MSRNGARTRSRKAGEKLPVFESGFYKEPWYYPGDGINGSK